MLSPAAPLADEADGRWRALVEPWLPVLARLALTRAEARAAAERALANATSFAAELVASGRVSEHGLFRAIADELELPFLPHVDPVRLMVRERYRLAALGGHIGLPMAQLARADGTLAYIVADRDIDIGAMRARLALQPGIAARLCIAPPSALRAALLARTRRRLLFNACHDLFVRLPRFSARLVANAWQGVCVGMLLVLLPIGLVAATRQTLLAITLAATLTFFACVALRLLALGEARPLRLRPLPAVDPAALPVYSVLVALYRESEIVPQLLVALGKLHWPHSKLDIKLVCEADDRETLAALRACSLRPCIEIVEVPPGGPRTKPKALAYALPLCRGDFVTLYDAEDCPHPLQLVEAWLSFRVEDERLACLQAPLVVTNGGAGPLPRMFAFEYAGLFRGLLPWLARQGLVFPLGGTSNHFRRAALVEAGGWDPHNVTEDADLGLRLMRFGYRTGVISYPTFEDAPLGLKSWLPQRVRWFKGWAQTWLVHMRAPGQLWRELGPSSFCVTQILLFGMLLSALIHPLCVASVLYVGTRLLLSDVVHFEEAMMSILGLLNIVLGYGAFLAIGHATLSDRERRQFWKVVLLTPVHWLLLSVAAWLALWEIWRRPHHWAKTHHPRRAPAAVSSAPPTACR